MNIDHVTSFIESRFRGTEISPAEIESKIRAIVKALDIFEEPDGMRIRFAFGTPIDDENSIDDWKEKSCMTLADMPDDLKNKRFTVYEIWYDGDDEYEELCGVEVMMYQR